MNKKFKILLICLIVLVVLIIISLIIHLSKKNIASIVVTKPVTNITSNSATLNGITSAKHVGLRELVYGLNSSDGKCKLQNPTIITLGAGTGEFYTNLSGLLPSTNYCAQAQLVQETPAKTYSGAWITFKTLKK